MRGAGRLVRGGSPVLARVGLVAVVVAAAVTGCDSDSGGDPGLPGPTPTSETGHDLSDADMWLSFDSDTVGYDGATAYPDALDGPFEGRVVAGNGGAVERVPGVDGRGTAVAFPARCTDPSGCPRAMVEILPHPALNPGDSDFEYGAAVWLEADQTTSGSNIVQKGRFGTAGGLWKLQVDSEAGKPSCVLRSGTDQLDVRSSVSIADAAWHFVVCSRDADGLSIQVDDTVDRVEGRIGEVRNAEPVRIGSPGVDDQDDQFHGRVDDVFLRVHHA